jgi:hypothetical protein
MAIIPRHPRPIPKRKKRWLSTVLVLFFGLFALYPFWAFQVVYDRTKHHSITNNLNIKNVEPLATNNTFTARPDVKSRAVTASIVENHQIPALVSNHDASFTKINAVSGCLTPACINYQAARIARTFPDRTDQAWCIKNSHNETVERYGKDWSKDVDGLWRGILLVKVPKGASSTSAGVAIRISRRRDCHAVEWMHQMATEYETTRQSQGRSVSKRLGETQTQQAKPTFLFTTIRNPSSRAISTIFFHVISRTNNTPTDEFIIMYLRQSKSKHNGAVSDGQGGFQLRYTSLTEIPEHSAWIVENKTQVQNPLQVITNVWNTLDNYDFILVTERMDESLVAMALSMGLTVGDVLVTASKVAGSRYHFARYAHNVIKCLPTVKSFVSPKVRKFLDSDEWRAMNYGDFLLHQAASLSLDLTIERLGRDRFDRALTTYRRLRALEIVECAPHVKFPCSDEGHAQPELSKRSCYIPTLDFGCGYKCIDKLVDNDLEESS